MWIEIANSLQVFDLYKDYITGDASLRLAVVEAYEELLKFAVSTVKILRYIRVSQYSEYNPLS